MKIKIGGHEYSVEVESLEAENEVARCNYNNATITLDSGVEVQSIRESALLHEILHACNSTFGNDGIEHGLLDSLSEQLYQVLSDNHLLNKETWGKYTQR